MAYKITRSCPHCGRSYSHMNDEEATHVCPTIADRAFARAAIADRVPVKTAPERAFAAKAKKKRER